MNIEIGQRYLLTVDNWFVAPDGRQYKAVFGTVHAVQSSEQTLGIRTNAKSTNWYVQVGSCFIAGCQIHYAVRSDHCNLAEATDWSVIERTVAEYVRPSYVFDADGGSR